MHMLPGSAAKLSILCWSWCKKNPTQLSAFIPSTRLSLCRNRQQGRSAQQIAMLVRPYTISLCMKQSEHSVVSLLL